MVLAAAAKHTIQILELLEERRMHYTFPVHKTDLLLVSGFSLLWQCVDLKDESKIIQDSQKSLAALTEMMTRGAPQAGEEFLRLRNSVVAINVNQVVSPKLRKQAVMESSARRRLVRGQKVCGQ